MAERAEAALGFLRNHLLVSPCLSSPVPRGFAVAPRARPEREAGDSAPRWQCMLWLLGSTLKLRGLALGFGSWAGVSGVSTPVVARTLPKFSGPSSASWVWVLASFGLSAQEQDDGGCPSPPSSWPGLRQEASTRGGLEVDRGL